MRTFFTNQAGGLKSILSQVGQDSRWGVHGPADPHGHAAQTVAALPAALWQYLSGWQLFISDLEVPHLLNIARTECLHVPITLLSLEVTAVVHMELRDQWPTAWSKQHQSPKGNTRCHQTYTHSPYMCEKRLCVSQQVILVIFQVFQTLIPKWCNKNQCMSIMKKLIHRSS